MRKHFCASLYTPSLSLSLSLYFSLSPSLTLSLCFCPFTSPSLPSSMSSCLSSTQFLPSACDSLQIRKGFDLPTLFLPSSIVSFSPITFLQHAALQLFIRFVRYTHSVHCTRFVLANQESRYDLSSSLFALRLQLKCILVQHRLPHCAVHATPAAGRQRTLIPVHPGVRASFSAPSAESYSSFCGARQKFVSICKTFSLCARRGKFHIF